MKTPFFLLFLLFVSVSGVDAQWVSKTYTLKPGWNSIWLSGDATYDTVDKIFPESITQVWRWNADVDVVQFIQSPTELSLESEEWTVWKRDGSEFKLSRLLGNSAYLVYNSAASDLVVPITISPLVPANNWLISGANFMGFPALDGSKNFSKYFASFINNGKAGLPLGSKVYKYIGGNLSDSNPALVDVTNNSAELISSSAAYWFSMAAVSDFTGPLSYELASSDGLIFGRSLTIMTLGIKNMTSSDLNCILTLESSVAAPSGQPAINGPVALKIRTLNDDGSSTIESVSNQTITVPANGIKNVDFVVDRSAMTSTSDQLYASILRIKDTSNFTDVQIPVSAQPADKAGLWFCQVNIDSVGSTVDDSTATAQTFPLAFLIHQSTETASLLRQAYLGKLTSTGTPLGIATEESLIMAEGLSDITPHRFYSPIMPYNDNVIDGVGSLSSTVTWTIIHGANDPVNPFVHTYHPDHDNLNATFSVAAEESYTVTRVCTFTTDISNSSASKLIGNYTETITGLLKNNDENPGTISVSGTFTMQRLSEISTLTTQ